MMSYDAVVAVARQIQSATTYAAVFGALPSGDIKVRRGALRKRFVYLVNTVHPDHVPKDSEPQASDTVRQLNELYAAAKQALEVGKYDLPFSSSVEAKASVPEIILQSPSAIYRLEREPFAQGDFSVLYHGKVVGTAQGVIVKVAHDPTLNIRLEAEARILRRFNMAGSGTELEKISHFVPKLLDTFIVSDEASRRLRALVLPFLPGFVSVTDVIEAFPGGLDPRDAAWIGRRVLAQVLAARAAGVVHGAIVPDHVLVHPHTHDPIHIGWGHVVDVSAGSSARISLIIDRFKDWYPSEVFDKKIPDERTDLYMAGKTILKLLGGDTKTNILPASVPEPLVRVVLRCVADFPTRRPPHGLQILDEFTSVVRKLWGKAWRPLMMPPR